MPLPPQSPFGILFEPAGNKVELLQIFRRSLNACGLEHARIIAIDTDPWAPAAAFCDAFHRVPPITDPAFHQRLAEILERENIQLVIPVRGGSLPFWNQLANNGLACPVLLSSAETLAICLDKRESCKWLSWNGFQTPPTLSVGEIRSSSCLPWGFPWIAKDPRGSGSREVRLIAERKALAGIPEAWIVQPRLTGPEFTLNVWVDAQGRCRCVIPHQRLKVSDGDVIQAVTVRDEQLESLGRRLAEALPGARGPLNFQVFRQPELSDQPMVTDMNPRFGGGYTLVHAAGGHFADWTLREAFGLLLPECPTDGYPWRAGLTLVRYRQSIFREQPFSA